VAGCCTQGSCSPLGRAHDLERAATTNDLTTLPTRHPHDFPRGGTALSDMPYRARAPGRLSAGSGLISPVQPRYESARAGHMNPIGPMLALEARGPVSYATRPERSGSGRREPVRSTAAIWTPQRIPVMPERWFAFLLVSFGGGLRWGETTALARSDID
jgi:hypothetical protein